VRSLADDLRSRSDDDLVQLLAGRPDLLHPVPADMTALAARAGASTSTSRALDRLDSLTLAVAHAVADAPEPCTRDDVVAAFDAEHADAVRIALARLRTLALVWGPDAGLRLVRTARESLLADGRGPITWPPPPIPTIARDSDLVNRTAGQHALATVMGVTTIAEAWAGDQAPAVLRKGGIAMRDLTAVARLADADERTASLWIEAAFTAGLLDRDDEDLWRPTPDYDSWHDQPLPEQWVHLARGKLGENRDDLIAQQGLTALLDVAGERIGRVADKRGCAC
jgi:hypothetical protein